MATVYALSDSRGSNTLCFEARVKRECQNNRLQEKITFFYCRFKNLYYLCAAFRNL